MELPGTWKGYDAIQLRPPEFFEENGLVGKVMPSINALGEASAAYVSRKEDTQP